MTRNRVDRELWAAARVVENLAGRIQAVDEHVRWELSQADSFSDHTPGASDPVGTPTTPLTGTCATRVPIDPNDLEIDVWRTCGRYRPCGEHDTPVTLTAVERAAERRLKLNAAHADFKARCKLIVVAASDALAEADALLGSRLEAVGADKVTECRDGQHGKEGAIEWSDPTCRKESVKGGLCQAHYSKWVRWRTANGKKTPEIEDAA
jgi:hypothetical protein